MPFQVFTRRGAVSDGAAGLYLEQGGPTAPGVFEAVGEVPYFVGRRPGDAVHRTALTEEGLELGSGIGVRDVLLRRLAASLLGLGDDDILSLGLALELRQATGKYQVHWQDPTADRVVTLPDPGGDDDLVLRQATQALANKTLVAPAIASFINAMHDHQAAPGGGVLSHNSATDNPAAGVHGVAGGVVGTTDPQTLSNKTLTNPDINGGSADSLASLSVRSSGSPYDIVLASDELALTADRTILIRVGNNSPLLRLLGDLDLAAGLQLAGGHNTALNTTAPTSVTLPPSGILATRDGVEILAGKTLTSPVIQGTVGSGGGLTMPGFTLAGVITSSGGAIVFTPASHLEIRRDDGSPFLRLAELVGNTRFEVKAQASPAEIQLYAANGYALRLGFSNAVLQLILAANKNIGVNTNSEFGAGQGVLGIADAAVVPTGNPTGGGVLYVEGGGLKYRGSGGTVTTVANA